MRLRKRSTRLLAASLCLAVAVTCTGCKSKEVKEAESLINKIGDISASGHVGEEAVESLKAAQSYFDSLGDDQSKVENADKLQSLIDAYNQQVQKDAAEVIEAIDAIPQPYDVSDQSTLDAVSKARSAYDHATDDVKAAVSNYSVLEEVESAIDDAAVQNAIAAIDQIGTVTAKSGDAIQAAKDACAKVPADRLADVTNYQTLSDAQNAYTQAEREAKEAAGKAAVAKLKTENDDVEGITWYMPSSWPTYSNTRCYVLPYIGEQNGYKWLKCKVDYAANDWVFFTQVIFSVDGVKRDTVYFDYGDVTRDTALGAKLYESADFSPSSSQIKLLEDIANSQKTIIRFQGSDYYYDFTVPDKDKQSIKDVLAAYDYLT